MERRSFLSVLALTLMPRSWSAEGEGHPVLGTIEPVVRRARHVRLHEDRIEEVAGWLAYEALPWPDFRTPVIPEADDADTMDFIFLTAAINFAFTDFESHVVFQTTWGPATYSDSDAMMACLKRAYEGGQPILTGRYLAEVTLDEIRNLFRGNIEMPMLDERLAIFHEIGRVLDEGYGGRFHRFVREAPPRVYAEGGGLLDRIVEAFPSFRDESLYRGTRVVFAKRVQLLLWQLHARLRTSGFFSLEDPGELTIFADYIVPVALRVLGILSYSEALERAIDERRLLPRDSEEEVEIRALSIWACHLLTRAVNGRRPEDRQVLDTVVDGRLWTHYHETHWPHHLTVTTAY